MSKIFTEVLTSIANVYSSIISNSLNQIMNLMLFMMDASYVFGPMAGGALLAAGAGFPSLFLVAAALALVGGLLVTPLLADGWRAWRRGAP